MGQELLEINLNDWKYRNKRRYYLAINSAGHKVVRGSTSKQYTHATIYGTLYNSGYCYATFTVREDLAKRYSRRWEGSEVVTVKEISAVEARKYKKEIQETAKQFHEQRAQATASVYGIDREAI